MNDHQTSFELARAAHEARNDVFRRFALERYESTAEIVEEPRKRGVLMRDLGEHARGISPRGRRAT